MSVKCIKIEDEYRKFDVDDFAIPKQYQDCIEHVMIPHGMLLNRIERMALDIYENSVTDSLTVLCILKGAVRFCQDLMVYINNLNANSGRSIKVRLDYLRVKSYKNTKSGEVKIIGEEYLNLKGTNLLIVEDLIDTGKTMSKLLESLKQHEPSSIKVASLLLKRCPDSTGYKPDYCGFELPNKFSVGYATDYNDSFRDLDHICLLNEYGLKKYAVE